MKSIISRFMMPPLLTEEERLLFGAQGLLVGEGKLGGQMWRANTKKQRHAGGRERVKGRGRERGKKIGELPMTEQ